MVLQEDELQEIVNTVLSAVRTNSRTIDQLTPTSTPLNGDCIELSGGRKIAYLTLESHIAQAVNHKSIPVEELDNMGYSDADAFFKAMLEPHHTRYTVTSGHIGAVRNVGLLEMFSTPGYCTITQIFVTNLILRDGGVSYSDHSDWDAHVYVRHFNISASGTGSPPVSRGQWTPWNDFFPADEITPSDIDTWFDNIAGSGKDS